MNYVYLIKTSDARDDCYKIGGSHQSDLARIRSYGKQTEIIAIIKCPENYKVLEKIIKENFNIKFNLIRGTEYFCGNTIEMQCEFLRLGSEYLKQNSFSDQPIINQNRLTKKIIQEEKKTILLIT